jgi:hypothetical protein
VRASRGMGDINPSKMPNKKIVQKDNQNVPLYKQGGKVKRKQK